MLFFKHYKFMIPYIQIYFAESPQEIENIIKSSYAIFLYQSSPLVASNVISNYNHALFNIEVFYTTVINLTQDLNIIWRNIDQKSTRYEIKRADKLDHNIIVNEWDLKLFDFIRNFQKKKRLPLITKKRYNFLSKNAFSFKIIHNKEIIAAHIFLVDYPKRARLLISATADRTNESIKTLVSVLNRKLHWYEIQFFKDLGIRFFDFGGINPDQNSPTYPITKFKMSFGGDIIKEYNLLLFNMRFIGFFYSLYKFLKSKFKIT